MKTINNINTDLPLNEWLRSERDNSDILVILGSGKKSNFYTYKNNLNTELKSPEMTKNQNYDIMEIWDISNLMKPKLLWKREEHISEEDFIKEYERVFDNNVDWNNASEDKWCIRHDLFHEKITIYCTCNNRIASTRYITSHKKAEDFVEEYKQEIKKYLFGIE